MLMTNAFSHSVKLDVKRSLCYRGGAEVARVAHNHEDIRSKRISGIYHTSHWCIKALEHLRNPLSSEAERAAHNCEVGGSKPPGGIPSISAALQKLHGREPPPPPPQFPEGKVRKTVGFLMMSSWTLNGAGIDITQRQRWTVGPRSRVRPSLSMLFTSATLQKLPVIVQVTLNMSNI